MNTWIYVNIGINCIEDIHDYFEHLNIAISNTIDADYFWTFQYLRMKNRKRQAGPVWRLEASRQSLCPCTSLSVQPDLELFSVVCLSVFCLSVCLYPCLSAFFTWSSCKVTAPSLFRSAVSEISFHRFVMIFEYRLWLKLLSIMLNFF